MNGKNRQDKLSSIIMCCYNGAEYIDRSFESILYQTYSKIELIFINDGSTDNSGGKASSYYNKFAERGYELKIYSQENQGAGYAAINGLAFASGEYLSYLDVDDYIMPDSIAKRVEALNSNKDCNVVRTNAYVVPDDNINENKVLLVRSESEKSTHNLFEDLILGRVNNYAGTYMVRASSLDQFYYGRKIPQSIYGQNLQILLPAAYKSESIFIDKPLMKYIKREDSHSNQKSLNRLIQLRKGYFAIRKVMLSYMEEDFTYLSYCADIMCVRNILDIIISYYYNSEDKDDVVKLYNSYYMSLLKMGKMTMEYRMYYNIINKSPLKIYYRLMFLLQRKININRELNV